MELDWASVVARRMERHGLTGGFSDVVSAASAIGGAHAQVMAAAELSLAVRVEHATPETIRGSLRPGGSLVKTYGPRGTVHLLPTSELGMWCAALGAAPLGSSLPSGIRLEPGEREAVIDAIAAALAASDSLDGDELGHEVTRRVGLWADERVVPAFGGAWPRWRLAIQDAAYRGVLAFGENRGTRVTYRNPAISVERDAQAALGWLLRRYLESYGPAMPEHYARWLGVKHAWAAGQFAAANLGRVTIDGRDAFVLPGDTDAPEPLRDSVRLLPHFDPYSIGSAPRDSIFPGVAASRALGRGQAGVHPVLLLDGIVAGIWTGKRVGTAYSMTVETFLGLNKPQSRSLNTSARRIGSFLGLDTQVTLGEVTTGAHK